MNREPWRKWIKTVIIGWERMGFGGNVIHEVGQNWIIRSPAGIGSPRRFHSYVSTGGSRGDYVSHCKMLTTVPNRQIGLMVWAYRFYAAPLNRPGRSAQNSLLSQDDDLRPTPEPQRKGRKINRAIVTRTVRLITDEGHKILTRMEALRHAENMELDLVEVDGKQDPPVCKLMDFNRERFKERQREKEHKKKQSEKRRLDDLKEVRFSTRTEANDLELKAQMAQRLLSKGHRVKLTVIPHGNDGLEPKGVDILNQMLELLQGTIKVETGPRIEKQRAWVLIRPTPSGHHGDPKRSKVRSPPGEELQ